MSDDSPFVDRVADKGRTVAAVKPALVRLLEWQIDQEDGRSIRNSNAERDLLRCTTTIRVRFGSGPGDVFIRAPQTLLAAL